MKISSIVAAMRGFFVGVVPVQEDPMTFTVQRSKWLRGSEPMKMSGLNEGGEFCCLGFLCMKAGYEPEQIAGLSYPNALGNKINHSKKLDEKPLDTQDFHPILQPFLAHKFQSGDFYVGGVTRRIGQINDDGTITDEEREAKVTKEFEALGITVKFVD